MIFLGNVSPIPNIKLSQPAQVMLIKYSATVTHFWKEFEYMIPKSWQITAKG